MRQEMCNSLSENHNSESQDTNRKEQKVVLLSQFKHLHKNIKNHIFVGNGSQLFFLSVFVCICQTSQTSVYSLSWHCKHDA